MIEYALAVYLLYHLASRADIFNVPRKWVIKMLPSWVTYPLNCALCFTFWISVILTCFVWIYAGILTLSASILMAAPVLNMVLDMVVRALIRLNEPPPVSVSTTVTTGNIPTLWFAPSPEARYSFCFPDPNPSHVGRRARIVRGRWTFLGKEGIIDRHYRDADDCSGTFQQDVYSIKDITSKVPSSDCELL